MKSCPKCSATYPSNYTVCPTDATPLRSSSELAEGAILRGKYQILARIGEGGMGVVYKARHIRFDEVCALKMVSAHLAADEEFLRRFHAEALLMRRLEHPHALRVHDVDETEDGRPFIVMEFFEGRSLDKLVREEGPLEVTRACRIVAQACGALDAAHRLGIIHRDIKPSNLLIASTAGGADVTKVFDFGIAKVRDTSELRQGVSLTRTGFLVGTPAYMSPEQAQGVRGDKLDGRSDLYSLGIVLFEILTGRLPFEDQTPASLLVAHLQTRPPDPRELRGDIPAPLGEIVLRALAKEPEQRFASAAEMQVALEAIAGGPILSGATIVTPSALPPRPSASQVTQPRTPPPGMPLPQAPMVFDTPTERIVTQPPRSAPVAARVVPAAPIQASAVARPPAAREAAPEDPAEQAKTRALLTKLALGFIVVILVSGATIYFGTRPAPVPAEPAKVVDPSAGPTQPVASPAAPQSPPQSTPQSPPQRDSHTVRTAEAPNAVDLGGYLRAIAASGDGAREIAAAPPGFVDGAELDAEDAPPGLEILRTRHRNVAGEEVMQVVMRAEREVFCVFMAPASVPFGFAEHRATAANIGGLSGRKIEGAGFTAYEVNVPGAFATRAVLVAKSMRADRASEIIRAFLEGQ